MIDGPNAPKHLFKVTTENRNYYYVSHKIKDSKMQTNDESEILWQQQ